MFVRFISYTPIIISKSNKYFYAYKNTIRIVRDCIYQIPRRTYLVISRKACSDNINIKLIKPKKYFSQKPDSKVREILIKTT